MKILYLDKKKVEQKTLCEMYVNFYWLGSHNDAKDTF